MANKVDYSDYNATHKLLGYELIQKLKKLLKY
jgi:hypothetical protein